MAKADVELGPLLIGIMLNVMLYGVMIMQTFEYSRNYAKDPNWIKGLVVFFFLGDTINCGFNVAQLYDSFIKKFGNPKAITEGSWTGAVNPGMTSIISSVVQLYFAYTIWRLAKNKWIPFVIIFAAAIQAVAGVVTSVRSAIIHRFSDFSPLKTEVSIWLSFGLLADLLITSSLIWYLSRNRRVFTTSDDIISKAIRLTLQTALATTLTAGADLILFLAVGNNLHLIFNVPLCQLYTNCLMSLLNAGSRWKASSNDSTRQSSAPTTSLKVVEQENSTLSSMQYSPPDMTMTSRGSVHVLRSVAPGSQLLSHQGAADLSPLSEDKALEMDVTTPLGHSTEENRPEKIVASLTASVDAHADVDAEDHAKAEADVSGDARAL